MKIIAIIFLSLFFLFAVFVYLDYRYINPENEVFISTASSGVGVYYYNKKENEIYFNVLPTDKFYIVDFNIIKNKAIEQLIKIDSLKNVREQSEYIYLEGLKIKREVYRKFIESMK